MYATVQIMSVPPENTSIETYFTTPAFREAQRAGAVALTATVDGFRNVDAMMHSQVNKGFPVDPSEMIVVVYRSNPTGLVSARHDLHYHQLKDDDPLVPADKLGSPEVPFRLAVPKGEVNARGKRVLEVPTNVFLGSLVDPLVRAALFAPPEEHAPSGFGNLVSAWGKQLARLASGASDERYREVSRTIATVLPSTFFLHPKPTAKPESEQPKTI